MEKTFTKNGLYGGRLVITRNGRKYIITETSMSLLIGVGEAPDSYYDIEHNCDEDLTNRFNDKFDIVKVYERPMNTWDCCLSNIWNPEYRDLLWERNSVKEMTLAEVCEALGYEVKIVKEN